MDYLSFYVNIQVLRLLKVKTFLILIVGLYVIPTHSLQQE